MPYERQEGKRMSGRIKIMTLKFPYDSWWKLRTLKKKSHAPSWEAWILQSFGIEENPEEEEVKE